MMCIAKAENAFLGAALFLIPPPAAKGDIEAELVERLLQPLGLPHICVQGAVIEGVNPALHGFRILPDQQLHPGIARGLFAQCVHVLKLPGGIDMQQRKRRGRGVKRLARQMQHHRAVLAHRIKHHRLIRLGHHFAHDVDAFGFKPLKVGQGASHDAALCLRGSASANKTFLPGQV